MPKRFRNMVQELGRAVSFLMPVCALFALLTVFEVEGFFPDLVSHFQLQYFLAGVVGVLLFLYLKKTVSLVVSLVTLLASAYLLYPYVRLSTDAANNSNATRMAVLNVHTSNTDYQGVRDSIISQDPTLVVLLEIDMKWASELDQLKDRYPHEQILDREDNFGIAILSKEPFTVVWKGSINKYQPPILVVKFEQREREVHLYAVHPVPPATPGYYRLRNELLMEVAKMIRKSQVPVVLFGDLNTSMWAPSFKEFQRVSGLVDLRKTFGLLPTWPQFMPFLYIPIEHILVSPMVDVAELRAIPIPGSDHRGLLAEIDLS